MRRQTIQPDRVQPDLARGDREPATNEVEQRGLAGAVRTDQRVPLAGGASVILLDEPTAGMRNTETDNAVELIRRVSKGKTLVMVEHDMKVVFDLADVITVLVYGQVIASGPPQAVRANPAVQEAYLGALAA